MPVQLVENSIIAILYDGRLNGQQVLLTTHWRLTFVTPAADDPEMIAAFDAIHAAIDGLDGLNAKYLGCLPVEQIVSTQWFQVIWPVRRVRRPYTPGDGEGHVAGDALPPSDAHVITLQGLDADKHNIGNKHIGGVPVSFSSNGEVTEEGLESYEPLADALVTPIPFTVGAFDYSLEPVLLSYQAPNTSAVPVFGYTQRTTRVMRRRTVGLGS